MGGLTRSDIDDILRLIDSSDFDELRLETGDLKLELRRRGAGGSVGDTGSQSAPVPGATTRPEPSQATAPPSAQDVAAAVVASGGGSEVPSPMLGTFYRSAKPGADPFVEVGDQVTEETVIGIIEVMKLMNQVTAGVAGTVTEIIAQDGKLVEHGQTLIRVQPA